MNPLRRAYATLGLRTDAPTGQVRRRYRFLARRWHPDRHAGDPRNRAEAGVEMRRINDAYQTIIARLGSEPAGGSADRPRDQPRPGQRRLSQEEIDRMVEAIGSEGPVDSLLGSIGWVGSAFEGILSALFAVACVLRLAVLVWRRDLGGLFRDPDLLFILALLAVLIGHEVWVRSRAVRASSEESAE